MEIEFYSNQRLDEENNAEGGNHTWDLQVALESTTISDLHFCDEYLIN